MKGMFQEMISKEDILAMLQNGQSTDDIAGSMADALNAAAAEYKTIQEEEARKAQKAEQKKLEKAKQLEAKREAMRDVMAAIGNYCDVMGATGVTEMMKNEMADDASIDSFCEKFDEMLGLMKALERLANLEFEIKKEEPAKVEPEERVRTCGRPSKVTMSGLGDADSVLRAFLAGI